MMKFNKRPHAIRSLSLLVLLLAVLLAASSCSSGSQSATSENLPMVLNTNEYVLYQNAFYNGYATQMEGKRQEKTGIFTTLQDAYHNKTRYYVWGYNDNTLCCDWQWEFSPLSTDQLPPNGSKVKVSGTFTSSDQALDHYWLRSAEVETITSYTGPTADIDMTLMGDTLERVQIACIVSYPDQFEGKSYSAYGRISASYILEDPYYDNSWYIPYLSDETPPALGTESLLRGTIQSGVLADAKFGVRKVGQ